MSKLNQYEGLFHPGVMLQMGGPELLIVSIKNTLTMLSNDLRAAHGNTLLGEDRLALELMEFTRDELEKAIEAIQPKLDEFNRLYPSDDSNEGSDNAEVEIPGSGSEPPKTKLIYPGGI